MAAGGGEDTKPDGKRPRKAPAGEATKPSSTESLTESLTKKPAKKAKRDPTRKIRKADAPKLVIRALRMDDHLAVADLQRRCFPGLPAWTRQQFAAQLRAFPEGQIGIIYDGALVASSQSLIISRVDLSPQHNYREVCDGGMLGSHDADGDTLYGIDICVDTAFRGRKLARRLYDARKQLAKDLNLRAMLIAGRIPGYHRHADKLSPEQYVARVAAAKLRDQVITAQLANGFNICYVIRDYLPGDAQSHNHALLMEWINTDYVARRDGRRRVIDDVRIAAVQYEMRPVKRFEDFARHCEFFVDTASDYRCDFICFPELLTNQLLAAVEQGPSREAAHRLSRFTADYEALFSRLAISYNINIIAGTHLVVEGEQVYNDALLCRRDGSVGRQRKIHITPSEATWWGVTGGDELEVFDTDCGKIAILICYDSEFPELARIARAGGARIFFVPFNTDIRPAYLRVRTCSHARCVENNVYAVLSGPVGNLPEVSGSDIHYAQACILTPCDIPYSRDGIGAEATPNVETMLIHELDMSLLRFTEREGAVRTWLDRRHDLYRVHHRGVPLPDEAR